MKDHDNSDNSDNTDTKPMNGNLPGSQNTDPGAVARDAGCEAIYIPDEANEGPGKWQFSQKYDEGKNLQVFKD